MRKALIYLIMLFGAVSAWAQDSLAVADVQDTASVLKGKVVPMNGAFLQPLQERDSVLVADQLFYGFELKQVEEGTLFALPEWKNDRRSVLGLSIPSRLQGRRKVCLDCSTSEVAFL